MGSFNVACGISGISINCGEPIVLIPLFPSRFTDPVNFHVGVQSSLIYSNCYFDAYAAPIRGNYNDYGAIEDIEENANTRALEAFFDRPIEDIMYAIARGEWDDEKGPRSSPVFIGEFDGVSPRNLKGLGFRESSGLWQKPSYFHGSVRLAETSKDSHGQNYEWEILRGGEVLSKGYGMDEFLSAWDENIADANLTDEFRKASRTTILAYTSGMWVHGDVYDSLASETGCATTTGSSYVTENQLLELGFEKAKLDVLVNPWKESVWRHPSCDLYELFFSPYGIDIVKRGSRSYVYATEIKDVWNNWEHLTGTHPKDTFPWVRNPSEESRSGQKHEAQMAILKATIYRLSRTKLNAYGEYASCYNLNAFCKEWNSRSKHTLNAAQLLSRDPWVVSFMETADLIDKWRKKMEKSGFDEEYMRLFHPLKSGMGRSTRILQRFRDTRHFADVYADAFENRDIELATTLSQFADFLGAMYSVNKFLFPTMNGEQCGNPQATIALADLTKKIVKNQRNDDDWDADYHIYDRIDKGQTPQIPDQASDRLTPQELSEIQRSLTQDDGIEF